ncbi:MAG: hypothetical protein WCA77_03615 [Thermoplasmata archaeon]
MISLEALVAIVILVVVLVGVGVAQYALAVYRNRTKGGRGFVQRSRLTCPKCGREFDYAWVPGGALTAVRLGKKRYMACPLCHGWSTFNVWDSAPPPSV